MGLADLREVVMGGVTLDCCGQPMVFREVFGIRVYECVMRNHPRVFFQGDQMAREEDLPVQQQDGV